MISRKNWLFHGNETGAHADATLFSLIETCKADNVDVFAWLKHASGHIHQADTVEKLEELLPFNVQTVSVITLLHLKHYYTAPGPLAILIFFTAAFVEL
ncbi:MAG: transposase domain-containing protein [Gammaproteobacteria bacterium]|nr:transposase domain-containing protein [Gammaproteobacteria bacterium]